MTHFKLLGVVAVSLAISSVAFAQNPERDAQGIQALTQCVTAAGGMQAVAGIQDFTATGSITFNWPGGPAQGSVTAYGKGLSEFRTDSSVTGGTTSFIVNSTGGEILDINNNPTPLSSLNLMTAGSLALPVLRVADAITDTTISVIYVGPVTWNGGQAIQVHIAPVVNPNFSSIPGLSAVGSFDVYLDPNSDQLLALSENIWPGTSFSQPLQHVLQFSGYSAFQGITIPTSINETVNGLQTWSMTLAGIEFNTGLNDSLFNFSN
jgi:hypothetical protein